MLVNTPYVTVYCTENAIVQMPNTTALENLLYCGYYQVGRQGTRAASAWLPGPVKLRPPYDAAGSRSAGALWAAQLCRGLCICHVGAGAVRQHEHVDQPGVPGRV